MVHARLAPDGITHDRTRSLADAQRRDSGWRQMRRNPEAYARGSIPHPDHATVRISGWYRIHLNAEERSHPLGFLD